MPATCPEFFTPICICPRHPRSRETIRRTDAIHPHGNPTPAGFSCGRPHCMIPITWGCDWTEVSLSSRSFIAQLQVRPAFWKWIFIAPLIWIMAYPSHMLTAFADLRKKVPDECVLSFKGTDESTFSIIFLCHFRHSLYALYFSSHYTKDKSFKNLHLKQKFF